MDVLDGHEPDEVLVGDVVVEGHLGHRPDRVDRVDVVDLQVLFGLPDAAVGVLQYGQVEALFTAEVVVDHPLGGAGLLGDLVDAGTRIALLGEHRAGHRDQVGARALGIAQRLGARLSGHNPQLTASPLVM